MQRELHWCIKHQPPRSNRSSRPHTQSPAALHGLPRIGGYSSKSGLASPSMTPRCRAIRRSGMRCSCVGSSGQTRTHRPTLVSIGARNAVYRPRQRTLLCDLAEARAGCTSAASRHGGQSARKKRALRWLRLVSQLWTCGLALPRLDTGSGLGDRMVFHNPAHSRLRPRACSKLFRGIFEGSTCWSDPDGP